MYNICILNVRLMRLKPNAYRPTRRNRTERNWPVPSRRAVCGILRRDATEFGLQLLVPDSCVYPARFLYVIWHIYLIGGKKSNWVATACDWRLVTAYRCDATQLNGTEWKNSKHV